MFRFFRKVRETLDRIAVSHERSATAQERIADASLVTNQVMQESQKAYRNRLELEIELLKQRPPIGHPAGSDEKQVIWDLPVDSRQEAESTNRSTESCFSPDFPHAVRQFVERSIRISRLDHQIQINCQSSKHAEIIQQWLASIGVEDYTAPTGWIIISTGDDGSVLCESPSGTRRRYWFMGKPFEDEQIS